MKFNGTEKYGITAKDLRLHKKFFNSKNSVLIHVSQCQTCTWCNLLAYPILLPCPLYDPKWIRYQNFWNLRMPVGFAQVLPYCVLHSDRHCMMVHQCFDIPAYWRLMIWKSLLFFWLLFFLEKKYLEWKE